MLTEIICTKFKENSKKIVFNKGLNLVLGDNNGSNSIGKSTFLMIIDFVFGGDDYIEKCPEVNRNIGFHRIQFCFLFNGEHYYFIRNTKSPNFIFECNQNYNEQKEITVEKFRDFLKVKYGLESNDLSFRETVSGYFRIYQRSNYDEKNPLQTYSGEGGENCVIRLIKLYNKFSTIKNYEELWKRNSESLSVYKKSCQKGFIPKITKTQYSKNEILIEKNKTELNVIASELDSNIDIENLKTNETLKLKNKLTALSARLTRYETKRSFLKEELNTSIAPKENNQKFYDALKDFFPSVAVKKLSDVDLFHKGLVRILNSEIKGEIEKLNELIITCQEEKDRFLDDLKSYTHETNFSKVVLKKIETLVEDKNKLVAETESYEKLKNLEREKTQSEERLEKEIKGILQNLQTQINVELANLNKMLFSVVKYPPILSLSRRTYTYQSFDDNGTGTNYKNLIIFDMCMLKQTILPALIHDSILLKNIGDEPLENIFLQYAGFEKQIFVAFDRQNTYSANLQKLLSDNCILRLGSKEESLFGLTWNEKK